MKLKIDWMVGKPVKDGMYIVSLDNGCVDTTHYSDYDGWEYKEHKVIGWYPINNIEPYKA